MTRFFILCIFFCSTSLVNIVSFAQQAGTSKSPLTPAQLREFRSREIEDAFNEKQRGQFGVQTEAEKGSSDAVESSPSNEVKVSTSTPESEVHAAINPTDTTNIVI